MQSSQPPLASRPKVAKDPLQCPTDCNQRHFMLCLTDTIRDTIFFLSVHLIDCVWHIKPYGHNPQSYVCVHTILSVRHKLHRPTCWPECVKPLFAGVHLIKMWDTSVYLIKMWDTKWGYHILSLIWSVRHWKTLPDFDQSYTTRMEAHKIFWKVWR